MNRKYFFSKATYNAFLLLLMILLLVPGNALAQLFGGQIIKKSSIIPANLTLAQNRIYFLTSVYDNN